VRLISFPIAFILFFIFIYKYSITVCMVMHPFSLVNVSICVYKLTIAPSPVVLPLTFVF
jgi:hypothetical protein